MKEEKHNSPNKIESMVRPGGMQAQVKYRTEAHAGVRQDLLIKVLPAMRMDFLNFVCATGHMDLAMSPTCVLVISRKVSCCPRARTQPRKVGMKLNSKSLPIESKIHLPPI